ncbi:MAG: glycosyltransferase [Rhodobacterales bacterium]|nr:glycosyltransferase [Rhodobacterales bacterium]
MTHRRPRVLIVSPTYTHPTNQGNSARIEAMGRRLQAAGCAVELLFYVLDWAGEDSLAQMQATWDAVHLLTAQPLARQSLATCWGLDDWCPDRLVDEVARLEARVGYDAVIVNYVWLSRALTGVRRALRILDTHDLFGSRHLLALSAGVEPNWYFTTDAEEARGFDRADIVLAIQRDELAVIRARTRAQAMLVGHPFAPERVAGGQPAATFGYIASSNPWNLLSLRHMDRAFAGRGIDWLLAGRICDLQPRLRSDPLILGPVGSVAQFYAQVGCSLNPMLEATGLKIKTIEALAHDCPVIGTTGAFAGLDACHPLHACRDADEVARAALDFAGSAALRDDLRQAGRVLFAEYALGVDLQYDRLADTIMTHRPGERRAHA